MTAAPRALPPHAAEAPDGAARRWSIATLAVLAVALALRVHDMLLFAPLRDYDGPGHALNVFALYEGHLPDPRSWSGFHPPLFHALGALVWHLTPEAVPVHLALRFLSALAGFAALFWLWRALARVTPRIDAMVVTTAVACVPSVAIATSMLGNETTCMLFVTGLLANLAFLPPPDGRVGAHALRSGILGALAALAKATGIVAVGAAGLVYGLAYLRHPRASVRAIALACGLPALALAPFYLHLMRETGGSPLAVVSGAAASPDAAGEMERQGPGERHLRDYVSFPPAALLSPLYSAPELERSVPGLLYAVVFADGHGQFLPVTAPAVFGFGRAMALLGVLPTALGLVGLARVLRRPRAFPFMLGPGLFLALLVAAFLRYTWVVPRFSAVKASYLLPALLPAALLLALGLGAAHGRTRDVLRGALLASALADAALLWLGWWA